MRQFDTKGLTKEAIDQVYKLVLAQKLILEAKMERMTKEMAVGACAIEDGLKDPEQIALGLKNLIAYADIKVGLPAEMNPDKGSLELIEMHVDNMKAYVAKMNKDNKGK